MDNGGNNLTVEHKHNKINNNNLQRPICVFYLEDDDIPFSTSVQEILSLSINIRDAEKENLQCFLGGIKFQPHSGQPFLTLHALNYPTSVYFGPFFLCPRVTKREREQWVLLFDMSTCMAHIAHLVNLFSSFGPFRRKVMQIGNVSPYFLSFSFSLPCMYRYIHFADSSHNTLQRNGLVLWLDQLCSYWHALVHHAPSTYIIWYSNTYCTSAICNR